MARSWCYAILNACPEVGVFTARRGTVAKAITRTIGQVLFLLSLLLIAVGWACADEVTTDTALNIIAQQEGGFLITTSSYQARLGSDGNLHSIQVHGVELLDDHTASSLGASFYAEHPVLLPTQRRQMNQREIMATDGVFTVMYSFFEGYISIILRHTNVQGASFVAVCAANAAYIEDQVTGTVAAVPADYQWPDVKVMMPTGEYLEFHGGTRVWGKEINRQVWECSNLLPERSYTLMLIPGKDTPPAPTLGQLTNLSVAMNHIDQIIPGGESADIHVTFENNSNQAVTTEMVTHIASSEGVSLLDERKPLVCAAHQSATFSWTVQPKDAGFYSLTCTVNLDGTDKILSTNFGYQIDAIKATVTIPEDFSTYWGKVVADASASDVKLTMLEVEVPPSRSAGTVKVYTVGIDVNGTQLSGWLSMPKYPGRYPGLIILPNDRSSNIIPMTSLADFGFVVLNLEPTGQTVNSRVAPLIARVSNNLTNPNTFGLRAAIRNTLCAITALSTVSEVDPGRIAISGAGLGGAMAMIVAALDPRIQAVAPDVPFYCQIERDSEKPDWPYLEIAEYLTKFPDQRDMVMKTLRYYDVTNFAAQITCPLLVSVGINDDISRPTNIMGVLNTVTGPHLTIIYIDGHKGGVDKHWVKKIDWLHKVVGGPAPAVSIAPVAEKPGTPDAVSSTVPVVPAAPVVPTPPAKETPAANPPAAETPAP